jgi:hypothetical protein
MENLISKAKLFLEAYTKAHPVLCTGSEKDVACYMAYHDLKNAIKEQEEKNIIESSQPQLPLGDVISSFACMNEDNDCEKQCDACKFVEKGLKQANEI